MNIKVRIGRAVLEADHGNSELSAAIGESNRKAHIEGLPDHLNPEVIDVEKAKALLAALPKLPAEELKPLMGRTLFLNYDGLMLGASAPTRPAAFGQPFKIEIADVQGDVVLARLTLSVDCALARERSTEARTRLKTAEDEVKTLEKRASSASGTDQERDILSSLSAARSRRYALARVWEQNARTWAACPGADSAAKSDLKSASRAVGSYAVPSSSGVR
jgi:hypothetical protein